MELLAKPGESLHDHTVKTLQVLASMRELTSFVRAPFNLVETTALALMLHDVGKAAAGFQSMLGTGNTTPAKRWLYRHEILSAALIPSLSIPEGISVRTAALTVLCHHKDLETLWREYSALDRDGAGYQRYREHLEEMRENLGAVLSVLRGVVDTVRSSFPSAARAVESLPDDPDRLIHVGLESEPFKTYVQPYFADSQTASRDPDKISGIVAKGLATACDHIASAGMFRIRSLDPERTFCKYEPNEIQRWADSVNGSAVLVAPTGSGKTEAALLWFRNNMREVWKRRVFYMLPTVASINKMYERLRDQFSSGRVEDFDLTSMQHHRSAYFVQRMYEDSERYTPELREHLKDVLRKFYSPIKVVTPYQALKHFFGVKGYEQGLSEMLGALLVMDEIHAYDPHTTALILVMLKILIHEFSSRVLLMSATLPKFIRHLFMSELGIPDSNLMVFNKEFPRPRHRLNLVDGDPFSNSEEIVRSIDASGTLVVCNTVSRAQKLYESLVSTSQITKPLLLHGRFALRDRIGIERALSESKLVVATQAIEVSLDLSFGRIFTEPAPIDALLQRFGRVNRRGYSGTAPVIVFRQGGDYDRLVYVDYERVQKTLEVLEACHSDGPFEIPDALAQELVEKVYECGFTDTEADQFNYVVEEFGLHWQGLQPFRKGDRDEFYRLFESVPVVPSFYEKSLIKCVEECDLSSIPEYQVSISYGAYAMLSKMNRLRRVGDAIVVDAPYFPELGLDLSREGLSAGGEQVFVF